MSIFLIPTFISLVFKLFILGHVLRGGKVSTLFLSLIIVFAIHNAIEATGYIFYFNGIEEATSHLLRLYYVATIFLLMYVLLHALTITNTSKPYIVATLIILATVLSALILFSDVFIAGKIYIGYTITAIRGSHYSYLVFSALSLIFSAVLILIYGNRKATTQLNATQCKYSLIALLPILSTFTIVLVFKSLGINVTASGIIPIATTMFLAIVLRTESKHQLSDIRRFLPLSPERETANNFLALLDDYMKNSNKENVYKDLQHNIEREIIQYSLNKCDNNVANTAKMMGIRNRSSLYAMINRLDINVNNNRQDD